MLILLVTAASLTLSLAASPAGDAALTDLGLADPGEDRAERLAQCGVDEDRLAALLALDQDAFDQDMNGGWRVVARQDGCRAAAADLIEVWRDHSGNVGAPGILYWHEGQMRAFAGQTDRAAALFDQARSDDPAWNLYVDASIAFLRRDRDALEAARATLARLRPSEAEQAARRRFLEENPSITMPDGFVEQPQNLSVVDRLRDCFASAYSQAYTGACADTSAPGAELTPAECIFVAGRFEAFIAETPSGDVRSVIDADWLTRTEERAILEALLAQDGRERGPDAPFAMGYRPEFARAVAPLTDADIERFHTGLTTPGPVDCVEVNTGAQPFTDDMAGFMAWADDQMVNPDPGAPEGAQTLSLSRPVIFDEGARALVMQAYSYTPIPLSRPPSASITLVVYLKDEGGWVHEASLVIARSG